MNKFLILLRGINVGGKNRIPMADLKKCLEGLGFSNVSTYIASGNVILTSEKKPETITEMIEKALPKCFKLDDDIIKILVLSSDQYRSIVIDKPEGFGEQPEKYHSDAIFLMGIESDQAMAVFNPREGVDRIWQGNGVIYSQRLSAQLTKSRLNKILESPLYKFMTIRSWNTVMKLSELLLEK